MIEVWYDPVNRRVQVWTFVTSQGWVQRGADIRLGVRANALNPKAVFFFLSIFSTVVSAHTPVVVKFGYGLVMATCLIAWFVGVSLFMTTPRMRAGFARMSQWIDRTSGVVFIALGIKLATEKAG